MHYIHTYMYTQSYTRLRVCITSIKKNKIFYIIYLLHRLLFIFQFFHVMQNVTKYNKLLSIHNRLHLLLHFTVIE